MVHHESHTYRVVEGWYGGIIHVGVMYRNGLLYENQLTTRSMVSAVTEEFWKVVRESINDEALLFKSEE